MKKNKKNYVFMSFIIFSLMITGCSYGEEEIKEVQRPKPKGAYINVEDDVAAAEASAIYPISGLPAAFALNVPAIGDQQQTEECVSFSLAYYIMGFYNGVQGGTKNEDLSGSPQFLYTMYKSINANDSDCKSGVFMFDVPSANIKGLANLAIDKGTCSYKELPLTETGCSPYPTASQIAAAAANKPEGIFRLENHQYSSVENLKSWLYSGFPVWFCVPINEKWTMAGKYYIWSNSEGENVGGHAMTVVGWDDTKQAFKIANSWGEQWGDHGFGWISYSYFSHLIQNGNGDIAIVAPNTAQQNHTNTIAPGSCQNSQTGSIDFKNTTAHNLTISITTGGKTVKVIVNPGNSGRIIGLPAGAITAKAYTNQNTVYQTYDITLSPCQTAYQVIS